MKKILKIIIPIFMLCLCGCSAKNTNDTDKISIVTTVFPEYDWVSNITDGTDADICPYL